MKNSVTKHNILFVITAALALVATILFSVCGIKLSSDNIANMLCVDLIQRTCLALFLIVAVWQSSVFSVGKPLVKGLLWSTPCWLVAIANFPFGALLGGEATVQRTDLLWVFFASCLLVGITEELFFRGIVLDFVTEKMPSKPFGQVIVSSTVFALWHLTNLLFGADIGSTLLQVGYSFLVGAMLATTMLVTRNIFLCIAIHALFDVGGSLVLILGNGVAWTTSFWIATVVCGVVCGIHVVCTLCKMKNNVVCEDSGKKV